jgi:tRNA dimethylallyltransferase
MSASPFKRVIIVAGPTAVGKTAVAIAIARHFHTSTISADSRQCYKELTIGVARPSEEELQTVPHYFIASHPVREEINAAYYEKWAVTKAEEILQQKDTVVLTGGTGLYIKAFCEGLDEIPDVPEGIRNTIIQQYNENGLEWLQGMLKLKDPAFYAAGEIQNPQRLMRALEVIEATGQSVLSFRKGVRAERSFQISKIGLELPREELYSRINARVDIMMKMGLLDEVKALLSFKHLNALQTVGYAELFDHLDGKLSLDEAVEEIKKHTRHYAKRQLTWFKKDKDFVWFHPQQTDEMIAFAEKELVK